MADEKDYIREVLSQENKDIPFERIPDESVSDTTVAVPNDVKANIVPIDAATEEIDEGQESTTNDPDNHSETPIEEVKEKEPLDAPEQVVDEQGGEEDDEGNSDETKVIRSEFKIPDGHTEQTADVFIGMANNLIHVGGGFFVRIKRHKEFLEFDEVIEIIDEQNEKNVNRIKLDEEDIQLLKPILIQLIKEGGKAMTPSQQLWAAGASILIKKIQVIIMIKQENVLLEEKLINVIKEQSGAVEDNYDEEENTAEETEIIEETESEETIIPNSVLEVADDDILETEPESEIETKEKE